MQLFGTNKRLKGKITTIRKDSNMKKSVFLTAICSVMLLVSCNMENVSIGIGKKIEPSSTITKKTYKLSSFDKIDINAVANVKIIQSQKGENRVVLSAPDNYIELFNFNVEGNELDVSFTKQNVNIDAKNVDLTIWTPTLSKLENSGVSNVETDRFTADHLEVENSGVGSLFLSELTVVNLEVECTGVGNIEISGTADEAKLECSGVGSIKAERLKAKSVKGDVSGVGGIQCYAEESLKANVSGVGSLKYAGKPQHLETSRSGIGKIGEL